MCSFSTCDISSCKKCNSVQCAQKCSVVKCARKCSEVKCSDVVLCKNKNNHEYQCSSAYVNVTCTKNFKGANRINAELNGTQVEILVNTGSTVNAISSELVKLLCGKIKPT